MFARGSTTSPCSFSDPEAVLESRHGCREIVRSSRENEVSPCSSSKLSRTKQPPHNYDVSIPDGYITEGTNTVGWVRSRIKVIADPVWITIFGCVELFQCYWRYLAKCRVIF